MLLSQCSRAETARLKFKLNNSLCLSTITTTTTIAGKFRLKGWSPLRDSHTAVTPATRDKRCPSTNAGFSQWKRYSSAQEVACCGCASIQCLYILLFESKCRWILEWSSDYLLLLLLLLLQPSALCSEYETMHPAFENAGISKGLEVWRIEVNIEYREFVTCTRSQQNRQKKTASICSKTGFVCLNERQKHQPHNFEDALRNEKFANKQTSGSRCDAGSDKAL